MKRKRTFRVVIAGSRTISDHAVVEVAMTRFQRLIRRRITCVLSGGARGVDALGEAWATANGVKLRLFPADWQTYGKAAGPIRNQQMAEKADALVAVWDGFSRGTKDMIDRAVRMGLLVHVYIPEAFQ